MNKRLLSIFPPIKSPLRTVQLVNVPATSISLTFHSWRNFTRALSALPCTSTAIVLTRDTTPQPPFLLSASIQPLIHSRLIPQAYISHHPLHHSIPIPLPFQKTRVTPNPPLKLLPPLLKSFQWNHFNTVLQIAGIAS